MGRSTTTTSPGVTIDSTPPDVTKVPIDVGSAYITEQRELSPTWSGVFEDTESGEIAISLLTPIIVLMSTVDCR